MRFDRGRDIDFMFKSNRIVCVEIKNYVEGEEIGVVVQPHDFFGGQSTAGTLIVSII